MDASLIASHISRYKESERLIFKPIFGNESYFKVPTQVLFDELHKHLQHCKHRQRKLICECLDASIASRERCADILSQMHLRKGYSRNGDFHHERETHWYFLSQLKALRVLYKPSNLKKKPHLPVASSADVLLLSLPQESTNELSNKASWMTHSPLDKLQLSLVSNIPTSDSNDANAIPYAKERGGSTTLNDIEIAQLSQVIDQWVKQATALWEDAIRQRIRLTTANSLTCCMFEDIKSYFARTSLMSDGLFEALSSKDRGYPFAEEFKAVQDYQISGCGGVADKICGGILQEFTEFLLQRPQRDVLDVLPPFVSCLSVLENTQGFASVQECGASRLDACLSLRLLTRLVKLTNSNLDFTQMSKIRDCVWIRFNHFAKRMEQGSQSFEEHKSLRAVLCETSLLPLIVHIDGRTHLYSFALFERQLSDVWVLVTFHFYVYLRMKKQIAQSPMFDEICKQYGSKLFKHPMLHSSEEWTDEISKKWADSYRNWALVACQNSHYAGILRSEDVQTQKIKQGRRWGSFPSSLTLLRDNYRIRSDSDDINNVSNWCSFDTLKRDLEDEKLPPNLPNLQQAILKTEIIQNFRFQNASIKLKDGDELIFDSIATDWENEIKKRDRIFKCSLQVDPNHQEVLES